MKQSIRISDRPSISNPADGVRISTLGTGADMVEVNPAKFDPLLYHLAKFDWALFGTVTWERADRRRDSEQGSSLRKEDFKGVMFLTCRRLKLRMKDIAVYQATEFGASGECHFHFLVGRFGLKQVAPEKFAREFVNLWQERFRLLDSPEGCGLGKAQVVPYDQAYGCRGVAYCLKREVDEVGRNRERYDYLSTSLRKCIRWVNNGRHSAPVSLPQ